VRSGVEGIVIGILKGEAAKRSGGYDVFVLVGQREPRHPGAPALAVQDVFQTHDGERLRRMLTGDDRLVSRPQIQAVHGDKKFRAVGKYLYPRLLRESFYDFQLNHLLWLIGKDWFDAEMAKPLPERHVILRWRDSRNHQLRKYQDPNDPDALVRAPVTGEMRALQVLADDLYQLAHALEPPRAILARLRDMRQFQGARYEILAASLFARCGFKDRLHRGRNEAQSRVHRGKGERAHRGRGEEPASRRRAQRKRRFSRGRPGRDTPTPPTKKNGEDSSTGKNWETFRPPQCSNALLTTPKFPL
jgi:hypothetical protein